ncbi:MAG: phospho-sugar mutase, partial [Bacteroidales bacterium]|nr:phospho-sugar mutase [Bacteroidales bacterium]
EFGFYKEQLMNLVKKGKEGAEEIAAIMDKLRNHPPVEINGSKVIMVKDYLQSISKDLETGNESTINLPKSNVLQFFLADGSKVSVRPSGTEPKIKFYASVKGNLEKKEDFEKINSELDKQITNLLSYFK